MATKRIKDLANTATESDLVAGNYLAIDCSAGTKKIPADYIAQKSVQNILNSSVITGKTKLADSVVANNASLNWTKKIDSDYIWIYVESDFMTSFRVYYIDSNGVNPNRTSTITYEVGKPQLINVPRGYDTIWLYGFGQTNTTGVSKVVTISKYEVPLEVATKNNGIDLYGVEIVKYCRVDNSDRLSRYVKYTTSSVNFRLDVTEGTYPYQYKVYFSDSTGILPDNTSSTANYNFGETYSITIPTGYDSLWFFCGNYNTTGSLVIVSVGEWREGTINRRVQILEKQIGSFLPLSGKNIVCFGDSITQFKYNGKGYPYYLQEISGANVVNGGIGGTRYSARGPQTTTPTTEGTSYRALDICNLVHSWANNDWSYVDPAVEWLKNNNVVDLTSIIAALKAMPIDNVDIVTIMAGTNDYSFEISLGTSGNTNTSTVFGGINSIIQDILTINPKIRIFMFSPTVRWYNYTGIATSNPSNFSDNIVKGGLTLKQFSDALIGEIKNSHIPVCDMYNTLGWNMWNFGNYFLDTDGTHPYKGFENIANRFYAFLTALNN